MTIALWILTAIAVALWSLFAWAGYQLLTLDPRWLDDLNALAGQFPYGEALERWLPGWQALLGLAVDLTKATLTWIGGVAPWAVWTVWGTGTALMVGTAALLALAIKSATPLPARTPGAQ